MKKGLCTILAVLLMGMLLAACGGTQSESEATSSSAPEASSVEPANSETEEEEPEAAFVSEDVLVVNEGREIQATLVLPLGEGPFPLVVMNHGFAGSRQEGGGFALIAETFAEAGVASIRLDFAGCGDSTSDFIEFNNTNNISDSNACLDWALENAPVDEDRLGIFGYSNGGRLSIIITAEDSPYKAMGLLAPAAFPTSEERIAEDEANLAEAKENGYVVMEWFGAELHIGEQMYEDQIRDYHYIDNAVNVCPTLVVYGGNDVMVEPEIATAIAQQIEAEVKELPEADHGFGFYEGPSDTTVEVADAFAAFFAKEL